jgi:hypothetical protein
MTRAGGPASVSDLETIDSGRRVVRPAHEDGCASSGEIARETVSFTTETTVGVDIPLAARPTMSGIVWSVSTGVTPWRRRAVLGGVARANYAHVPTSASGSPPRMCSRSHVWPDGRRGADSDPIV